MMNDSTVALNAQLFSQTALSDGLARQQLEDACRQQIYAACVRQTHFQEDRTVVTEEHNFVATLLSQCEWNINTLAHTKTLAIQCPDLNSNWLIVEKIMQFGGVLKSLAIGKVRVCPPVGRGTPLEVQVHELSMDRD